MSSYIYLILVVIIVGALIYGGMHLLSPSETAHSVSTNIPSSPTYNGIQFEPPFALHIVLTELISNNQITEQEALHIGQDTNIGKAISQMKTKAEIMVFIVDYIKK